MVKITPQVLSGTVKAPPSKSYAHRAVIAAFLSGEKSTIKNLHLSADITATLDCAAQLGSKWKYNHKSNTATIESGKMPSSCALLDCGESGSTLRFFIPIAMVMCDKVQFTGHGRLMERPLDPYFEIFKQKNIKYSLKNEVLTIKGKLTPGTYEIDGLLSSQFITGLLYALPLLEGDSEIKIKGSLTSRAYIDITLDVLKTFGIEIKNENYSSFIIKGNQKYKAKSYTVEGDFSNAAFWLVAGALGCDITCTGLNKNSLQGDKAIIEIIESTGAAVERIGKDSLCVHPSANMHGISVDADSVPDLVPILAVLFCFCKGTSRIENAGRLRIKESDRLAAITAELTKMGADITEGQDFLEINGKQILNGAETSAWNDHRIAMAAAIAALRCEGDVFIDGAKKAVKKSYPNFFEDYKMLGGNAE